MSGFDSRMIIYLNIVSVLENTYIPNINDFDATDHGSLLLKVEKNRISLSSSTGDLKIYGYDQKTTNFERISLGDSCSIDTLIKVVPKSNRDGSIDISEKFNIALRETRSGGYRQVDLILNGNALDDLVLKLSSFITFIENNEIHEASSSFKAITHNSQVNSGEDISYLEIVAKDKLGKVVKHNTVDDNAKINQMRNESPLARLIRQHNASRKIIHSKESEVLTKSLLTFAILFSNYV